MKNNETTKQDENKEMTMNVFKVDATLNMRKGKPSGITFETFVSNSAVELFKVIGKDDFIELLEDFTEKIRTKDFSELGREKDVLYR